jgi:uncharacterized membrane protein YedE/YeeE
VLFEAARQAGLLRHYPFPLLYPPSLANILGGFLFGTGMVLAGGCVVGTLYKMGAGSALSALAFAGLIAGSALYAEMHPLWASFAKATTFFPGKITLSQITGTDPLVLIALTAIPGALLVAGWYKKGKLVRASLVEGYMQPWTAALCLSLISLLSYVLVGMPMGVTSSYAKVAAYIERFFFEEHLMQTAYFQAVPLNYINPLNGASLQGGAGPQIDAIAAIQFPLVAGIVLGSAVSALMLKEFRIYLRLPFRQYISAFTGGVIMAVAARIAPTCNVWHLLGGIPVLAASSLLFLSGLLPGAWLGSKLLTAAVLKR